MNILAGMEFDIFVPSFPDLQIYFNLTPFWVEALLSINFLGYCLGVLIAGSLTDRCGRKPIIIGGLIMFIVGSVLCLTARSYNFIFIGRFLQGLGVSAPAVLGFVIISDLYPMHKQQYLLAMLNGIMNLSVAVAPVIGSYLTMYFHWQSNFLALLLLGIVTLFMTSCFVPAYKLPDYQASSIPAGYADIFKLKPLMLLISSIVFVMVPYWVFVGISPLLYIKDLGVSLNHFGYYQGSLALVFALGCILYGMVINRYDHKKMLVISGGLLAADCIVIAWVSFVDSSNPMLISLALLPFIVSQVIHSTLLYPLSLNLMPHAKGRVAAIIQGGRLTVAALGLQIAGYCYNGSFRSVGIVLAGFMLSAFVLHCLVLKNSMLMKFKMRDNTIILPLA